jgi:hypothetical protein
MIAAQAAMHALAHIDGEPNLLANASLETTLPSAATRRRSWPSHPACGCAWTFAEPQPR